jgi:hypothetical protein
VTQNTSITFCLSSSRRTYTIQCLSVLRRLFACTPSTTSLLLCAPPTSRLTASHARGSLPYHPLRLFLSRIRAVQPAPLSTTASKAQDTSPLSFPDSGGSVQVRSKESVQKDVIYLSPQEYKRSEHGRKVPPTAQLQYLQPQLIAHHKLVFTLPKSVRNDSQDLQVMVTKANSITGTWYVECDIVSSRILRESTPIQLPVVQGKTPTANHNDNQQDLFSNIFHSPVTGGPCDSGRHRHFRTTKRARYASIASSLRCGPRESVIPARMVNPYTICSLSTIHKQRKG